MKKNKKLIKKLKKYLKNILLFLFIIGTYISFAYAIDTIGDYIQTRTVSSHGTNTNYITVSKGNRTTYYINKDSDEILSGDKLRGFYYDNIYGYFRLDWSTNLNNNVHISSTTAEAVNNYPSGKSCNKAWKFSGKAYSKYVGHIDFNDTTSGNFVYYCEDDHKLYGKAYSDNLGSQVFDGIQIRIKKKQDKIDSIDDSPGYTDDNSNYNNDNDTIKKDEQDTIDDSIKNYRDSNIGGGDWYELQEGTPSIKNDENENIFWIIK